MRLYSHNRSPARWVCTRILVSLCLAQCDLAFFVALLALSPLLVSLLLAVVPGVLNRSPSARTGGNSRIFSPRVVCRDGVVLASKLIPARRGVAGRGVSGACDIGAGQ